MALSDTLLSLGIGLIMFGIGLNISFDSFVRIITKPKAILTGLTCQIILLPAIAFGLASLWPMPPAYKAGLVLIAACPGGTASNLVTHMLKGRVALSVSLTAFNSFIILLTIPVIVNLATSFFLEESYEIEISFLAMAKNIVLTVLLPTAIGMVVHIYHPEFTKKLKKPLRYILPAILLIIFAFIFFSNDSSTAISKSSEIVLPALALNVLTILLGYAVAGRLGIRQDGRYTIAIEMGLQNSALAVYIAHTMVKNYDMALVAVVYSSFTFFTTWGLAAILKRQSKEQK